MKAASLFLIFLLTAAIAQPPGAWTPEYSLQVQNVSGVVPSPDGQTVAWVQTKPKIDAEHSEQISQIFIARADGSHRLQLTRRSSELAAILSGWTLRLFHLRPVRQDERLSHTGRRRR